MTRTLLDRQSELPRALPLFRYAPERVRFSLRDWDPALVRSAEDLPQYLVLGHLDPSSFRQSATGWSARWQGTEEHTHFDVAYKAEAERWEIRQTWCGLDGGFSVYPTRMPLGKVIAQALYMQFPRNWDSAAKSRLESEYQITYVEQPENAYTFCGIPDGAFRTIVFPVAVRNLLPVRQWIQEIVEESPLTYPITVEVKLIFQALNYLEGKAPDWTTQEAVVFNQSVIETGLAPHGFPVREVTNDGSAAWTLRREIYFLFIGLPFAGLTDFLGRMVTDNGPIRAVSDPDLRFELRPVAIPAAFEMQTESVALWDQPRTTRSFLQFARPGEAKTVPTVEQVIEAERNAQATLAKVEAISGDVVAAIEQIFQRVTKGGCLVTNEIDLDYRPDTYFRPQKLERYLLSKVKGAVLRKKLQALFDAGRHAEVPSLLTAEGISAADRKALESFHPMFMGGNYLPDTEDGEVEIARISIKSTTYDVTCVYARPEGGAIHYRVVDEYGGETLQGTTEAQTDKPMTLGEFAGFFLGAWPLIDVLEMNFENNRVASLDFFSAKSAFYPDFDRLCRQRVIEHFAESEEEDNAED